MLELHHYRQIEWSPSPVVALAASVDGSVVAAARDSGAIELWIVAPGAVGWHRQLVFPGQQEAAISCLVWCHSESCRLGRLFSAGLDGFITEWDLTTLLSKHVSDSHGGPVWQVAAEPIRGGYHVQAASRVERSGDRVGTDSDDDSDVESSSGSDDDDDVDEELFTEQRVAVACDDGCVRLFVVRDAENGMHYQQSFPGVKARILSVVWSVDATRLYAGSSDGCIRCWDVGSVRELYRITVGVGGLGGGSDICVWSLLFLRDGTLVSGDSSGTTQFWDSRQGTLLQAYKHHKADVLALAAGAEHRGVFAAGADGQISLYRFVTSSTRSAGQSGTHIRAGEKWIFAGSKRAHTHDVRALTVAHPLVAEEGVTTEAEHRKKSRRQKPSQIRADYQKWAVPGIPMLVSGGNDSKLFTYPAESFLNFHPHDICIAPESPWFQVARDSSGATLIMSQHACHVDVWRVSSNSVISKAGNGHGLKIGGSLLGRWKREVVHGVEENGHSLTNGNAAGSGLPELKRLKGDPSTEFAAVSMRFGKAEAAPPEHLVRIKSKERAHICCSAISVDGAFVAFSCLSKTRLVHIQQKRKGGGSSKAWEVKKVKLPQNLPTAHKLAFSSDSSRMLVAGPHGSIVVVDVQSAKVLRKFDMFMDQVDSPVSLLCTSLDGQWLAAVTSVGHICVYNLETLRHHWSIPVLDGACVTAAVFHPKSCNVLVVGTASNQLHVLDIEAKMLSNWSKKYGSQLPREFLEFPGGLSGLSMPPSADATSLIVYSPRAMCYVDFLKPVGDVRTTEAYKPDEARPSKIGVEAGNHIVVNGHDSSSRRKEASEKNFVIARFEEPVLFLCHVSEDSVFVVEKPWIEVLHQRPAPIFRHLYGT